MQRLHVYLALLFLISGCAIAPFNSPTSARSMGKGYSELNLGLSPWLFASGTYGLSKNFDIGASLEVQAGLVGSLFSKYAFINHEKGSSFSLFTSIFSADSIINSNGFTVGPIYSYRANHLEPFLNVFYSYADFEKVDPSNQDIEDLQDTIEEVIALSSGGSTQYLDTNIGINYWLSSDTKIYLYAKNIYFFEYSFSEYNSWIFGLGAGFKMGSGNQ